MSKIVKKEDSLDLKVGFNDFCMREMGLDLDEYDHVVDVDTESILQLKEKFFKYSEDLYPILQHNEIDFNLLENFRLMDCIFQVYITKYAKQHNMNITGFAQSNIKGTNKGVFFINYKEDGQIKTFTSDAFENESVRVFNLICKLNHRDKIYNFDELDVIIEHK